CARADEPRGRFDPHPHSRSGRRANRCHRRDAQRCTRCNRAQSSPSMTPRRFLPLADLHRPPERFDLLPFQFARTASDRELLVNEAGEYVFAGLGTVESLVRGTIDTSSELYAHLKSRHFLTDDQTAPLLDVLATKVRTKRLRALSGPTLHIFVVTLR